MNRFWIITARYFYSIIYQIFLLAFKCEEKKRKKTWSIIWVKLCCKADGTFVMIWPNYNVSDTSPVYLDLLLTWTETQHMIIKWESMYNLKLELLRLLANEFLIVTIDGRWLLRRVMFYSSVLWGKLIGTPDNLYFHYTWGKV